MSVPEEQALKSPEYWDKAYSKSNGETPTHEWYRSFSGLEPFFQNTLFGVQRFQAEAEPKILHLGSGDSDIPARLADHGYQDQICIDFSWVAVELMKKRHKSIGIKWACRDVRNMNIIMDEPVEIKNQLVDNKDEPVDIKDKSFDIAFDKGTMDAMMDNVPSYGVKTEDKENASKYMKEVHRVLKDDGVFICVSYRPRHSMRELLNSDKLWDLEVQDLSDEGSIDYSGYVMKKAKIGA